MILESCGPALPLSFIKPLIDIEGIVPDNYVKMAKEVIVDKKSELYKSWNNPRLPYDFIAGFEYIADYFGNMSLFQTGGTNYLYKFHKYRIKYMQFA